MSKSRLVVVLSLALGVLAPGGPFLLADEPRPTPAPAGEPAGEETAATAERLSLEVVDLYAAGRTQEAIPIARRCLALFERLEGKEGPNVANALLNLGTILSETGAREEGLATLERALATAEAAHGPEHAELLPFLLPTARELLDGGALPRARSLLERALALQRAASGADSTEVVGILQSLAVVLERQSAYPEAKRLLEDALAITVRQVGKDHPAVAGMQINLAGVLRAQGDYAGARALAEGALAVQERRLGPESPALVPGLNTLAATLQAEGRYAEAKPRYERAIRIQERAQGRGHPAVAGPLRNLASLLHAMGSFAEARSLLERALAIEERAFGQDHPRVLVGVNNLAGLLLDMGLAAEARPLFARALAWSERTLGPEHPLTAAALNNVALVWEREAKPDEAVPLLRRALAAREKAAADATPPGDSPEVAAAASRLAAVLISTGGWEEASALLDRALALQERLLGAEHPQVAQTLTSRARTRTLRGDLSAARADLERALSIRLAALGPAHPQVLSSMEHLAFNRAEAGDFVGALAFLRRSLGVAERDVRERFLGLSGRERFGLMATTRTRLQMAVVFAGRTGASSYEEVLRMKGIVGRAEASDRAAARRPSAEAMAAQEALREAERRVARLANDVRPAVDRAAWQAEYAAAMAERDRRTTEVRRASPGLDAALGRFDLTVADVQAAIGPSTALVDWLRLDSSYAAWILRRDGEAVFVRIEGADQVEETCAAFVAAIAEGGNDEASRAAVAETGLTLRTLLWDPIAQHLGSEVEHVVLCPDAALASIPFAALPGRVPGRSLLDDHGISYVRQAQDLVPRPDAPPQGTGALIVGGVDYDRAAATSEESRGPETPAVRAPRTGAAFAPIPSTRPEAETLAGLLGRETSTLLLGAEATESRVRGKAIGKRFIHIATHGFSRDDLFAGLYSRKIELAWTSAGEERQFAAGHDPMLLSGLALAGANARDGGEGEDGILTALEASSWNLEGVEVVTLSACDTAKGTATSGEGVLGLVAALQMAGARHVLASLWKVDDEGTRILMEDAYARMLHAENPLRPAEALREAALALRDRKDAEGRTRFASPRYWAAFVVYGL